MSVVTRGNETLELRNNLKGTGGPQNLAGHWHSRIKHGDELSLGYYKLRADAARAYDYAARLLKGPKWPTSYATEQSHNTLSYIETREKEMKFLGINVDLNDTLATIESKVKEVVSKANAKTGDQSVKYSITEGGLAAIETSLEHIVIDICSSGKGSTNSPVKRNLPSKSTRDQFAPSHRLVKKARNSNESSQHE
mmetsp:Transcript_22876/g.37359  ORF Transcript_22876/g.37359 Transcript_22876/m.37359 type:complete len:195 (+) Transcript_22876:1-585(+)